MLFGSCECLTVAKATGMNERSQLSYLFTRNRLHYALALAVVIPLGLGSRKFGASLPWFIAEYAGDTLWAMMMFLLVGFLAPRWTTGRIAAVALGIAYTVEISQLYRAPWVESIRHTLPGALVLGSGFLWSDFVCYTVGVGIGTGLDIALNRATRTRLN